MQDLAREIASLLEPSEPLGYRLVMHSFPTGDVIFEAKAVRFKGGNGFLVRCSDLPTSFAPTEDALKFLIRKGYNSTHNEPRVVLLPPHHSGLEFDAGALDAGVKRVNFCVDYKFEVGEFQSQSERVLRETVAALTLMAVPEHAS